MAIKKIKKIAELKKQIKVIKENYIVDEKNIEVNSIINLMEKQLLKIMEKKQKNKKYFKPKSFSKSAKRE